MWMLKYENIGLHGSVWKASFCIEFLGRRETQQGVHFRWLDDDTRRFVGGCFCFHVFALHFSPSAFLSCRKEASGSGLNPFGGKRNASAGIFFSVWKRNFVVVLGVDDASAIDSPWRDLTSAIDQKTRSQISDHVASSFRKLQPNASSDPIGVKRLFTEQFESYLNICKCMQFMQKWMKKLNFFRMTSHITLIHFVK